MTVESGYAAGCAEVVDARGLNCPLPLLKTKRALAAMQSGERVYLCADAPQTLRDVAAYVGEAGHRLVVAVEREGVAHLVIEKTHRAA